MRRFFYITLICIAVTSCHRKKNIIYQSMYTDADGRVLNIQRFLSFDSVIETATNTHTGLLYSVRKAASQKKFSDSTFATSIYYDDGKINATQNFTNGKPDGAWISWYENGQRKSESVLHNGTLLSYHAWTDNGTPQVDASRYNDGRMIRYEYYPSGPLFQEFETDSVGNGKCTTYFLNAQKSGEGNLFHFKPNGLWKRYDSLGNSLHDTLYGISSK